MATVDEILKERAKTHGSFEVTAYSVQTLKMAMQNSPNWPELDMDQKEALEMIVHKIGRILCGNKDHLDAWQDMAGYATLVANRLGAEE
jgi:hypothetical protein